VLDSLRVLLSGAIDYAGLYPPARLPLDQAWANFLAFRTAPEAWMLSRFVCPTLKLAQLSALADPARAKEEEDSVDFNAETVMAPSKWAWPNGAQLTVIGQWTSDRDRWDIQWIQDCNAVSMFQTRHGVGLNTFEVKLPSADMVNVCMPHVDHGMCYLELADPAQWRTELPKHLEALNSQMRRPGPLALSLGYKLRTGGLDAAAFPSCEQVASAIVACRNAGVQWKATAGLHHPVRHFDPGVKATMHGFLNLLFADVLAHVHRLDVPRVQAILEDEDPSHFLFMPDQLMWSGPSGRLAAEKAEIVEVRQKSLRSFGSCSFDDPRTGLRAMGLELE
jgi:hypothetical protein